MANEFLMNFVVVRRRKVELFKASTRRKAQKFIAIGLMSSAFFGYLGDVRSKWLLHLTDSATFGNKDDV